MPSPFDKKLSIDNFIYESEFNQNICYLSPNEITILGMIVTIIIGYLFYTEKYLLVFIFLVFFRSFCDIYDGMIARKCNKTTSIGKYLDVFADTFYAMVFLVLFFIKTNNKYWYLKIFIVLLILITPVLFFRSGSNNHVMLENNSVLKFTHDNTILVYPILSILIYFLSIRLK